MWNAAKHVVAAILYPPTESNAERTIQRDEFVQDPSAALARAKAEGPVTVLDNNGDVRGVISVPSAESTIGDADTDDVCRTAPMANRTCEYGRRNCVTWHSVARVRGVCRSAASFIAAIDRSSEDVAAYLEQRFGPALRLAYERDGRAVFEEVERDARQLATKWKLHVDSAPSAERVDEEKK